MENKKLVLIILAIIGLTGSIAGVGILSQGSSQNSTNKSQNFSFFGFLSSGGDGSRITANTFIPKIPGVKYRQSSADTDLFSAVIEYDPINDTVSQNSTQKIKGDILSYKREKPRTTSDTFVYKIDVVSKEGKLLQQGWESLPIEAIVTKNNTYLLQIATVYEKDATIMVSSSKSTILWAGIIQ